MDLFIACVTFDCADPRRLSAFWAAALGYATGADTEGWVVLEPTPAGRGGPRLGFQRVPEPKAVKNRAHLDLRPAGDATMEAEVDRLVGLGARVLRLVTNGPESAHMVMQDPEGNEFCLVRP